MAENWAADVRKYVPDANEKAIAGIVKYCGIAPQKRDSSLESCRCSDESGAIDPVANSRRADRSGR
jgi:hypothetical protein